MLEQLYNPAQNAYAVSHLYDVTVALDGLAPDDDPCRVYSYFNMHCHGVRPRRVHLRMRRWHIADELPPVAVGRAALGDWLAARWQEKDQMLARFHATGSLAASHGADGTYVWRVRCRWTPSELWPYALVIAIYATVGTLTWQLLHFL